MTEVNQAGVHRFNDKHDVTEDQQFRELIEEVGELSEAYNTDAQTDDVAMELADVIFVARSLAELRDIDVTTEVNTTITDNLQKNTETDGDKVTKDGLKD